MHSCRYSASDLKSRRHGSRLVFYKRVCQRLMRSNVSVLRLQVGSGYPRRSCVQVTTLTPGRPVETHGHVVRACTGCDVIRCTTVDGGIAVPWFTFHRSSPEALTVAENIRANYQTFLQRPEWPRASAAAFLRYDHPTGETHFYFSPAFAEAEPFMVELYRAGVCSPPKRQVGLALLVGQFGAIELLAE